VEVDDRRTPDDELGPQIAAGRDATIHDAGPGRVLRRTAPERDLRGESEAMEHVRAAGYPVPVVHRVGPGEQVLERVDGPTMLADLEAHPWRVGAHARLLGDLHARLHRIGAPTGLRPYELEGDVVLHLDLHPGNVILAERGPVVIDWTNARRGPAAADVALSWILMGAFELDQEPLTGGPARRLVGRAERAAIPRIRRRLVRTFLAASGVADEARALLGPVAEVRLADRNVRPGEATAIRELVARHAAEPTST